MKILLLKCVVLLFISSFVYASEVITPSHVYQEAISLKSILYKMSDRKTGSIQQIKIESAQPLHVYAITTALNEKVAILNNLAGLPDIVRPEFPDEDIEPKHVLKLILAVQKNIMQHKYESKKKVHTNTIKGKTPVDVLRVILACNILLDQLIAQQLVPKHPLTIVQGMKSNLIQAIASAGKELPFSRFKPYSNVEPRDVFINTEVLFKVLTNTTHLKFGLSFPQRPFYLPSQESDIKPIHVFTVSVINYILLKDLIRRSGYEVDNKIVTINQKNITPAHVYAAYEEILFLTRFFIM